MYKFRSRQIVAMLAVYAVVDILLFQTLLGPKVSMMFGVKGYIAADLLNDFLVITLLIRIGGSQLKEQVKLFFHRFFHLIPTILSTLATLFGFMIVMGLIFALFGISEADNKVNVMSFMENMPLLYLFDAVIYAPFTEEMIFRGCLCQPFDKKHYWLGVLLCGAAFGSLHCAASLFTHNWSNLIYFFVYAPAGMILALPLRKEDTLLSGMMVHMIYNFLLSLL